MLCQSPIVQGDFVHGCGQCLPCRYNKRRVWTHRIMLEQSLWENNAFVTLTYSDEKLPVGGTLVPSHLSLFLKRLRYAIAPERIRFFGVGEYGDQSERPHYHLALFNYRTCERGRTDHNAIMRRGGCCNQCDLISREWGLGGVDVGLLEPSSAAYVCGYVAKKWTDKDDFRLNGRHPEFARMSKRPGLGAGVMDEVASTLLALPNFDSLVDVPTALSHGKRTLPLGNYLVRRLRTRVGREPNCPQAKREEIQAEMSPLRIAAKTLTPDGKDRSKITAQLLTEVNEGKLKQIDGKYRRRPNKGSL